MRKIEIKPGRSVKFFSILLAGVCLLSLVFVIYSNTYHCSWHFDDYENIIKNTKLHLTALTPNSIEQTFFAKPGGDNQLYRPISNLSFALNWFFDGNNVVGYHIVNISIHFLCSFLLFLTIYALLCLPNSPVKKGAEQYAVALLAALLWAANPVQVESVTYIVQRMASLAALFYILSMDLYINARQVRTIFKKYCLYTLCFISAVLAIGSKENAVTLPLAILLVEVIFFQDSERSIFKKELVLKTSIAILLIFLIAIYYLNGNPFNSILGGYARRPFTCLQRVLSAPRILIFYLSLLFYPIPSRLSITHEFVLSTSLFHPWTTLPSWFIVLGLIFSAIFLMRRYPIYSFSLLFFFIGHLVESTVIALDPIFEHRNYLPSMFLFVPVIVYLKYLTSRYNENRLMQGVLIMFIAFWGLSFAMATYMRNMDWFSEKTLWQDAIKKAPGMARTYQNLAWGYYERNGKLNEAIKMYKVSLHKMPIRIDEMAFAYNNIGNIYYKMGNYEKAVQYMAEGVRKFPEQRLVRYNFIAVLIRMGKFNHALKQLDVYTSQWPKGAEASNLTGFVLLKEGKPKKAISYFKKSLALNPNNYAALMNMGVAFSMTRQFILAKKYLQESLALDPKNPLIILCLAENSVESEDPVEAQKYMREFIKKVTLQKAAAYLQKAADSHLSPPLKYSQLSELIKENNVPEDL